jgi:hypothetical protein
MLFSCLLDTLQVRIPTVFSEELDDIDTLLPVELESIGSLVMNVILRNHKINQSPLWFDSRECLLTHLNWHLIDMNPLLNAKVGNDDIECLIQDPNNSSLSSEWAILLCQIRHERAEV